MNSEDAAKKAKVNQETDEDTDSEITETKATKKDTVNISKKELQLLFQRLEALESDKKGREDRESGIPTSLFKRNKDKLIKLRRWNDAYVLGWTGDGVYEEDNPSRPGKDKRDWWIELLLEGSAKPVKVNYLEYLNESKVEWAKVIKTEVEEDIQNFGAVHLKAEKDNRFIETDDVIPLDVKYEWRTYTVETQEGNEFSISEKFIH